jgi:hypothetical protein
LKYLDGELHSIRLEEAENLFGFFLSLTQPS